MSTFDIEAAKRGEPVEVRSYGDHVLNQPDNFQPYLAGWIPVRFVGTLGNGRIVLEDQEKECVHFADPSDCRMAPKKIKVRYRVAIFGADGRYWPVIVKDECHAESATCNTYFVSWVHHDWQEAGIEQ